MLSTAAVATASSTPMTPPPVSANSYPSAARLAAPCLAAKLSDQFTHLR